MYTCVRLSLLPSLFVKQIYFFVLFRFMFAFFLFASFRFLHCLLWATLSVKNNFLWWVVNHCPLFFVSCSFIFLSTPSFSFQKFQNWWIIHLRVSNSISKISIAYVFYNPPQSDIIIIIIINLRHLAWTGQAYRVYALLSPPQRLLC